MNSCFNHSLSFDESHSWSGQYLNKYIVFNLNNTVHVIEMVLSSIDEELFITVLNSQKKV